MDKAELVVGLDVSQLNPDEISKFKSFLKTIQDETCSLAQQGACFHSNSLNVSKTNKDDLWILDSGATNHISHDLTIFDTYKPLGIPKHITIANGTFIPIKGQGKVILSPILPIKQVLHVPNLSTNLISIHQLIKELNCRVIFSPSMNFRK